MGILSYLEGFLVVSKKPVAIPREDIIRQTYNILRNSGITCRCKSLAIPTKRSGRIYRCVKCKKQFSNTYYNLNIHIDNEHYDEAVELLKKLDS